MTVPDTVESPQKAVKRVAKAFGKLRSYELGASVDLSDDELEQRKADWKGPRETIYASGALWKYAQLVGEARSGAVTHPGGSADNHVYAAI